MPIPLHAHSADVANNKAFLLQGGDCAELFEYCNAVSCHFSSDSSLARDTIPRPLHPLYICHCRQCLL